MKQTRILMGMPVTVAIVDEYAQMNHIDEVFGYFIYVDNTFSTYKETSEISKINNSMIKKENYSDDMKEVLALCDSTKKETNGFFDIYHDGKLDPSGLVKGWAIRNASDILKRHDYKNYYIEAGGDIQVAGCNENGEKWRVGIRNPFNREENVKIVGITDQGIATSGTAIRGNHIYTPSAEKIRNSDIVSFTVIGPSVYDADRFATAAFAMGEHGIDFIASLHDFSAYVIDNNKKAIYTNNFTQYVL